MSEFLDDKALVIVRHGKADDEGRLLANSVYTIKDLAPRVVDFLDRYGPTSDQVVVATSSVPRAIQTGIILNEDINGRQFATDLLGEENCILGVKELPNPFDMAGRIEIEIKFFSGVVAVVLVSHLKTTTGLLRVLEFSEDAPRYGEAFGITPVAPDSKRRSLTKL